MIRPVSSSGPKVDLDFKNRLATDVGGVLIYAIRNNRIPLKLKTPYGTH